MPPRTRRARPPRRRPRAAALLTVLAIALTGTIGAQGATPTDPSASHPTPDLAPRALDPEELDPVTIERLALRYELDGVALEVLGASRAPGLVLGVALGGQTVFLEAYGSAEVGGRDLPLDAPLWLASLTKPLTAIAVLRLAAEGRLDLDADAATLLPAGALGPPAHPGDGPVTVRHLLTHTAGLDVRALGGTVAAGATMPNARDAVAAGLPPRVAAPGAELVYCNACYLALAAIVEGVTGQDAEDAYRALVFEPLGFAHATLAADADAALEATTVTPHAVGPGGLTPLTMPRLLESGAGRARASARDLLAFAEALTDPTPRAGLPDAVRGALLAPAARPAPAAPGWTLGFAETAVLGHAAVRHDGDLPGVRATLLVVPEGGLAVFAYLNGAAIDDGLEAASGRHDARDVLLEAVVARVLGDVRDPADPGRGWPAGAATAATAPLVASAPAPGAYRLDRVARRGPERMLGAALPTFAVAATAERVVVTPPAALAAATGYVRAPDGVWRSERDGAPLVVGAERLHVHLGTTVGLARVAWLQRPATFVASHAAAAAAALAVLVAWPLGAFLRWRRREPTGVRLPAAVGRVRAFARAGAFAALAVLGVLGWLVAGLALRADAPLAATLPWLQALAALLALATLGHVATLATGAARHPRHAWRWALHAAVALAFAALLAQGWTWGLWSPDALATTWDAVVGGGSAARAGAGLVGGGAVVAASAP